MAQQTPNRGSNPQQQPGRTGGGERQDAPGRGGQGGQGGQQGNQQKTQQGGGRQGQSDRGSPNRGNSLPAEGREDVE